MPRRLLLTEAVLRNRSRLPVLPNVSFWSVAEFLTLRAALFVHLHWKDCVPLCKHRYVLAQGKMVHISIPHFVLFLLINLNISLPSSSQALGALPIWALWAVHVNGSFILACLYLSHQTKNLYGWHGKGNTTPKPTKEDWRRTNGLTCFNSECTQADLC